MSIISNLKLSRINKKVFSSKPYKYLNKSIFITYVLFMLVYMFREKLYKLDNQYITLFAWSIPNLIPSFLFTLVGIFYIVPMSFKSTDAINKPKFI